jgi:hypothetical protein
MTLASPSKRSRERWSHLAAGPPLVRFARPSTDITCVRRLPGASSHRPDSATCRARSALVVSHHLDGLLRTRVRGFVAPRNRSGVHRVSETSEPVPSEDGGGPPSPFPAARVHTLRRVSSSTAGAASLRSVALLPLPALTRPHHAAEAARREVGPGEPGAAGPPNRPEPERKPADVGRRLAAMKLRSAETADPHFTGAPGNRRTGHPMRGPSPGRRRSADAGRRSSPERGSMPARRREVDTTPTPGGATVGRHAAETADHSPTRPVTEVSRADPTRRRERPTSGPCSVERVRSVAPPLPAIRHPILPWALFPSKVHSRSAPARSMPGGGRRPGPKPETPSAQDRRLRPIRAPLGSLRRLPLARHPPKRGATRRARGPKPTTSDAPFQRGVRGPGPLHGPLGAAEAVLESGEVSPESVRRRGREAVDRDALRCPDAPRGGNRRRRRPAGDLTDLHGVLRRQRALRGAPPRSAPDVCPLPARSGL